MSNDDLYKLIKDRFEASELVDLLDLDVEEICRAFEDEVLDNMDEIKELLGLDEIEEDEESNDYDETE